MFCQNDEQILLKHLNALAPTTFLRRSSALSSLDGSSRRRLDNSVRDADVVHVHTLWNPINRTVRRACARHRRPYVLMPHGMLDPYSLSVKRWRKALYLWAIEQKNISSAHRLIYTTEEEARLAASQLPSVPKSVVIPLGGNAPNGKADELASQFLARYPQARNRRQLLFLGRLHFKKGLDRILMALPGVLTVMPDVLLTVAGDGEPQYEETLRNSIKARGLESSVLMTGRLDGDAKWGAYASAELFLLPSRQENFAITVAEAMQMGVPVVISNKVNTWPYVKEAGAGLILAEGGIEADLEKSLVSLLQDSDLAGRMGRQGRDYARKNLTWGEAMTSLVRCYDEVLARGHLHDSNC